MRSILTAAALALAASAAHAAHAAPTVQGAWTRPAAKGQMGGGYMTLRNPDAKADTLLRVESPLATSVQIHETRISGGMAGMKPVARLPLPAGGSVTFAPGGYHLMFTGLSKAIKVGDTLPATLVFASGARVKAAFVASVSPPVANHDHH